MQENNTPSTELPRDFCAWIGPLQLGVVLVFHFVGGEDIKFAKQLGKLFKWREKNEKKEGKKGRKKRKKGKKKMKKMEKGRKKWRRERKKWRWGRKK